MSAAGPDDEAARAQWRRDRREVVRRHHPDRGGDPEVLRRELELVDRRWSVQAAPAAPVGLRATRRVRTRIRRRARSITRSARGRIPRGWVGSRRWTDLP